MRRWPLVGWSFAIRASSLHGTYSRPKRVLERHRGLLAAVGLVGEPITGHHLSDDQRDSRHPIGLRGRNGTALLPTRSAIGRIRVELPPRIGLGSP